MCTSMQVKVAAKTKQEKFPSAGRQAGGQGGDECERGGGQAE